MKLLLDENLSPRIAEKIQDLFPGSCHLEHIGLRGSSDTEVWSYARDHCYMIVSKDSDFRQRSFQYGPPPKVCWLDVGNAGTQVILRLLRQSACDIERIAANDEAALLVLTAA